MIDTAKVTLQEIRTQTKAWAEAIQIVQEHLTPIEKFGWDQIKQLLFCGCGSTYYLSLSAAALFQSMSGKICRAFPSSELILSPTIVYPGEESPILLIAVSRSGITTETIQAVQIFKNEKRGAIFTVTNYEESPLARMGNINLCIPSGKEQSIAQTKSFASMFMTCVALASAACNDHEISNNLPKLIPTGERIINTWEELAQRTGQNHELKRFFFLGSGIRYGLACEVSLKMKEMALTESEPFHFLEFRHGPISMVDQNTLVIGLLSEENQEYEKAVLSDVKKLGGQTLTLGEVGTDIEFNSGIPELGRGVLYLPILQLMAYYRAVSFGLNPDKPRYLSSVIELEFKNTAKY
jgi:glucosamine--fructose-6-phosphate aminotransferase (isomerizing)